MALTDKNIIITPNTNQSADPKIIFSGADASTTAQNITLQVYPTAGGTLSFEGSAGQLFSVTNNMSGTIYSVNDISGIPSIEVLDTGLVKLAQYSGNVVLGTGTDNGTDKLQVSGTIRATGGFNGLTSSNVTTALGYTPYNSTNPAGYTTNTGTVTGVTGTAPIVSSGGTAPAISISAATTSAAGSMSAADKTKLDGIATGATANTGTVTSVGGTGSYGGLTLSGTVTSSGNLTLGGTPTGTWPISVSGSSYSCTGNAATASAVNNVGYGYDSLTWCQTHDNFQTWSGSWASHLISNHGDGSTYYNQTIIMPFWSAPQYMRKEGGTNKGPYTFITTENQTSYAPTLTGTGASGTWGISISGSSASCTGNAATATYATSAGDAGTLDSHDSTYFATASDLSSHTGNTSNPHSVTATQVGLGNVTNESKATMFSSPTFTGTVSGVTASMVGLGNVENKSSATIRSEITSSNVTTALGYTPYNSTNPAGYTTNTGTVTSVGGTGSYGGLTLSGTVTSSGNLTLGGTPTGTWPISISGNAATASYVNINYNNDTNSTYQMLWGSGTGVYGSAGIYCNPSNDYIYSTGLISSYIGSYGDIVAQGNVTAYGSVSDKRLKENIIPLSNALEKVQSLNSYQFNYIGHNDKLIGVIAQEIEEIVPEVVYNYINNDGETFKAVRYENITALLIEAVKELKQQLDKK